MNTKHFILAVAAVAFAACTQIEKPIEEIEDIIPETPAYSDTPIALTYSTVDAVETKAAQNLNEGTFASGEGITVRVSNAGENAWTDYAFTTGAAGAMVAPDPAPYYPAGAQNIDIVAYYPASAGTSFTVAADQTSDASYKASDLMFASVTNQAKQAETVNLACSHKMAKLNVNITPGQGVSSINSLSVLNVKPTVSFNQATGVVGEATGSATTIAMSNEGSVIIPAQTINGGLLSIVTDMGTATYSVADKVFEAGKLYTINITVNLRAVGTTTEITGWTSEGTVNVTPGDWTVTVSGSYTYTGSAIVPDAANITVHSTSADADIDAANYDVFINNNINAGEATLIVSGKGTYAGEVASCTYTIGKVAGNISYATTAMEKIAWDALFTNTLTKTGDGIVSYESSNESVATVNSSTGEVTLLARGETTITATIADGTNYTYATNTASYTLSVEAASLSNLKTKIINAGSIYSYTFLYGYEVYDNGNIAAKGAGRGTVVGHLASFWASSAADTYFPESRILVIASEDAETSINWATNTAATGLNDSEANNGYSNTKTLMEKDNAADYLAAKAAWGYQSKNGSPVVTGSSGWFLPSYAQMSAIRTFLGAGEYWTSTEEAGDYSYFAYYMGRSGNTGGNNKASMTSNVRACFAY